MSAVRDYFQMNPYGEVHLPEQQSFPQSHIKRAEDKCMVSVCFKVLFEVSREKCEDLDRNGETKKFFDIQASMKVHCNESGIFCLYKMQCEFCFC